MLIFGSQTGRLEKRFEGLWKHVVTRPPACRPQFEAAVESTSWRLQQPLDVIHRRSLQRQNVITRPEGDVAPVARRFQNSARSFGSRASPTTTPSLVTPPGANGSVRTIRRHAEWRPRPI